MICKLKYGPANLLFYNNDKYINRIELKIAVGYFFLLEFFIYLAS